MDQPSFFGTLTDFSFSSFVTTRFIKLLYALLWIVALLNGVATFLLASAWGWDSGTMATMAGMALGVVVGFVVFLFNLIFGRIFLEILVVVFRIAENTQRMADRA
ncbi:MAG: DUF4282 domain-containing protein [Gemmatimonadales bacterium]|nr:MAG: DUF4282 domain-containing protein [Gemmatimonadales bacterium]